jgi:xanthine dehydrogenase small subunit
MTFLLNESVVRLSSPSGRSVLDYLRKERGLYGTREGCREGECGACTVILGRNGSYRAVPSCLMPLGQLDGTHLVTIEGLDTGKPNRLQQAFIDEGASQCGFCTSGFILSLTGYLMGGNIVSLEDALDALDGNICRCTGYASIRRAVEKTIKPLLGMIPTFPDLVDLELLPSYFTNLPDICSDGDMTGSREGTLIAGGTDLYIQRGDTLEKGEPRFLIPGAGSIRSLDGYIEIPGTATMEQLRLDPLLNRQYEGLGKKLLVLASSILRNRATLGGNMVNASPIADTAVLLLAWDGEIQLVSPDSKRRRFPLKDFFMDYKKLDLKEGEIVEYLYVKQGSGDRRWNFTKVSKRERLDIASVNSASVFILGREGIRKVRLAFGGVAPIPYRAVETEKWLEGKPAVMDSFLSAFPVLLDEIHPIDDVRGSAEYKKSLAAAQLADHFLQCFPDVCTYEGFLGGNVL